MKLKLIYFITGVNVLIKSDSIDKVNLNMKSIWDKRSYENFFKNKTYSVKNLLNASHLNNIEKLNPEMLLRYDKKNIHFPDGTKKGIIPSQSMKLDVKKNYKLKGRGRRRDHKLLALVIMGFMVIASILIPTGFQFLTVLGGKSLLMAKMALIMSAISGLKKIATSNVGYGFYHGGNDDHHHDHAHHGFHDKLYQASSQQIPQYGFNY